jgi:hypothetical protein
LPIAIGCSAHFSPILCPNLISFDCRQTHFSRLLKEIIGDSIGIADQSLYLPNVFTNLVRSPFLQGHSQNEVPKPFVIFQVVRLKVDTELCYIISIMQLISQGRPTGTIWVFRSRSRTHLLMQSMCVRNAYMTRQYLVVERGIQIDTSRVRKDIRKSTPEYMLHPLCNLSLPRSKTRSLRQLMPAKRL